VGSQTAVVMIQATGAVASGREQNPESGKRVSCPERSAPTVSHELSSPGSSCESIMPGNSSTATSVFVPINRVPVCVGYLLCCVVETEEQPETDRQLHANQPCPGHGDIIHAQQKEEANATINKMRNRRQEGVDGMERERERERGKNVDGRMDGWTLAETGH